MISLILWALAPIFNAIMDITESEAYFTSVFPKDTTKKGIFFWYKRLSWNNPRIKKVFGYKFDGWHIAKSIMIILIVVSTTLQIYFEGQWIQWFSFVWLNLLTEFCIKGLMWNTIFTLFYHKLFRSKTWATK